MKRTSMHIVVFTSHPLWQRHFATELELIQNHLDAGDRVTVLKCYGELLACDLNEAHEPGQCWLCQNSQSKGIAALRGMVEMRSFRNLTPTNLKELHSLKTTFANVAEMQQYSVENFDIGMAALSSVISNVRDAEPDFRIYGDLLRRYILSAFAVYRSIQNYIDAEKPDKFYIFNGRMCNVRAILRACESKGVAYATHECGNEEGTYSLFENALPHDIVLTTSMMREHWQKAGIQNSTERGRVAAEWYEHRSQGNIVNGYTFTGTQQRGLLPENWDSNKRNFVFFTTGSFEYVTVGSEYKHHIYEGQMDGLRQIIATLKPYKDKVRVYIRIHPNLKNLPKEIEPIKALECDYVTTILPDSNISTYGLIQCVEKVLIFNSTTGIEATYFDKPSILAGRAAYQLLDVTYNPNSHEELMALLLAENLPPKNKEGALIYGYFFNTFGYPLKHYQPFNFFGGTFNGVMPFAHRWWFRLNTLYKRLTPTLLQHKICKEYIQHSTHKLTQS